MAQGIRRPHEAVDFAAIERLYPPPPEYYETACYEDPEAIERKQLARLKEKAWRTYQVPFHRDRWDAAGFHPRHIKTLEDLWRAPFYTVDDIRKQHRRPPAVGRLPGGDARTGLPGADAGLHVGRHHREVPADVLHAVGPRGRRRADRPGQLYMQGIRPGDVVLNSWSYGIAQRRVVASTRRCTTGSTAWCSPPRTGNVTSTEKPGRAGHRSTGPPRS